jgi:hypothetical protein
LRSERIGIGFSTSFEQQLVIERVEPAALVDGSDRVSLGSRYTFRMSIVFRLKQSQNRKTHSDLPKEIAQFQRFCPKD